MHCSTAISSSFETLFVDYQRRLIEDQQHVDHVSGIPLPHLTFIMQHILPVEMFLKGGFVNGHLFQQKGVFYHFLGSFQDETEIFLRDISWNQKSNNSMATKNSSEIRRIVVLSLDKEVIYERGMQTWEPMSGHLYVDCSETLPGYCRLKLPFFDSIDNDSVVRLGSNLFQKILQFRTGYIRKSIWGFHIKFNVLECAVSRFHFITVGKRKDNQDFLPIM